MEPLSFERILECVLFSVFAIFTAFLILSLCVLLAHARPEGHENSPPELREWFQRQKQPDNPVVSCCGDYDAYISDGFVEENGNLYAIITESKNDIPIGTKVLIPPNKYPRDGIDPNPSGHGIVFMSIFRDQAGVATPGAVYCWFPPSMT